MKDLYLFPNYREGWNEKNLYYKSLYNQNVMKLLMKQLEL